MRKISLMLAVVLLMGLFTAMPSSAAVSFTGSVITEAEATLIPNVNAVEGFTNSGFEYGLSSSNWTKIGNAINTVERTTDAKNGSYALKITNAETVSADTQTGAHNNFKIVPGISYELSAWFKSEKTTGSSELHGIFYGTDDDGKSVAYSRLHLSFSISYKEWTKKIFRFTAPVHSTSLTIYCYNKGPGTVYYDDVSALVPKEAVTPLCNVVAKDPVPGTDYVINQNFESFDVGYRHHQSGPSNPDKFGGHHLMISDEIPKEDGSANKSLMFLNGSNTTQSGFGLANYYNATAYQIVPGATYQFSAWVNSPEFGTSSTLAFWVQFDAAANDSDIVKKTWTVSHYPWWQRVILEFEAPVDVTNAIFTIRYGSKANPTYLDDLQVYMVKEPAHAFVESDELFYYSEWEKGYVYAPVNSYYKNELEGGKVQYKFLDMDGVTVLDSCEVPYVNGEATYEFDTALMAQKAEKYFIDAKVVSGGGNIVQEELLHVYRYDRPTYLGADGIFRKNGKEYNIVLGNGVNTERLNKDPRTGGVTVVQIIADPTSMGTSLRDRMDKAHEMGLLCLINFYGHTGGGAPSAIEKTVNTVSWAKNHPALFGYKVQDEPYQKGEPDEDMERAYARIRKEDPNHPVYLDDSVPGGYKWLYRYADIIDIDYYGGHSSNSSTIFTEKLEIAAQATKGRKPFTLLQQAFQYGGYLPTVDELRHFVYQAFFAGVSGFGYHTLGIDGSDGVDMCYMDLPDWAELGERWAPWEQGFLFDAFVNDKFEPLRSYRDNDVMWKTFRDGKDIYAVMFNRNQDKAVDVSIPLTDEAGNAAMGAYTAYRAAGAKDSTAALISGNGSLNVTLGGIYGRNKNQELVAYQGMAAEIWKISPDDNLIPNGSFENDFAGNVPAEGWTASLNYGSGGNTVVGTISQVSSDYVNGVDILPATAASAKFLKLNRYHATNGNLTSNRTTRLSVPLSTMNLEVGKSYRFEGYVNIPANLAGVGMHFTSNISANDGDSISHAVGFVQRETATNGWEKKIYDFVYRGGTVYLNLEIDNDLGPGSVFFDELKIYEIAPISESLLSVVGSFEPGQSSSPFGTGSSNSKVDSSFKVVEDPDDASNYVLIIPDKRLLDGVENATYPVKMPFNTNHLSNLTVNDFLKYNFRVKVKADAVPENDLSIPGRFINTKFTGVNTARIDVSYVIPKEMVNTWVDVELITHAPNSDDNVTFIGKLLGYDIYVDDISVTKLTSSYVSDINSVNMVSVANGSYIARGSVGVKKNSFTPVDAVKNRIYFVPQTASDVALGIISLYKNVNNVRTLVDVNVTTLSANSSYPVASANTFGLDLSAYDLAQGNYSVEHMLWGTNFSTILSKISQNVIIR